PSGLTVASCGASVGLQWTPSANGTRGAPSGYRIYRQTFAGVGVSATNLVASVAGATVSTFVDSAVVSGAAYFYRVLAFDSLGAESGMTEERAAMVSNV